MNVINKIRYHFSHEYRIKKLLRRFSEAEDFDTRFACSVKMKNMGIFISPNATIGKNIQLPHPFGIIIGEGCVVKENVTVYQNVTLGQKKGRYPTIGKNCIIYPGALVFGGIIVGDDCVIGGGTVVNRDVPNGMTVVGNSMRFLG